MSSHSSPKQQQRIQIMNSLIQIHPTVFGYFKCEQFQDKIVNDFRTYPNQFFKFLLENIQNYQHYYVQIVKSHQKWGKKYNQFQIQYNKCLDSYAYNYRIKQQYIARQMLQQQFLYQQQLSQQQLQQQGQQGVQSQQYNNQNYYQNNRNNNYHNNKNYNQQQQGQQVPGQQGQQQQQNYQHHQTRHHYQNQQGQNPQQHGGYHKQYKPNYNKYQQQQQGTEQQVQGQQQQNVQGQYYPGYKRNQYQNNQHTQGHQYHQNNQYNTYNQQYLQQQQQGVQYQAQNGQYIHHQTQKYEQKITQQPVVVVQPTPPPKPQPKPMKFSLNQLRQFVSIFSYEEKQNVSQEIIKKATQVQAWRKGEESFQQKAQKPQQGQHKFEKKQSTRDGQRNYTQRDGRNERDGESGQQFNKGSKYNPTPTPDLVKKPTGLRIQVGKNQTLQTKMIKNDIKSKAGLDFATLMQKQNLTLNDFQKSKKEIIFNLNLLAPENIKDIQKDLLVFLFNDKDLCQVLIEQIIQKAWTQPKYASTYAKLCQIFSKYPVSDFKFSVGSNKDKQKKQKQKQKKQNPFKVFLISTVQHSFDKKVQQFPVFENDEQKQNYLKQSKKKILGNVKFIAELIRSKILKRKIIKICMSQLLFTFLSKYYFFRKTAKLIDSYYDYYFQALIQFIQNLGDVYQKMDQGKQIQDTSQLLKAAQKNIIDLIQMNQQPPEDQIEQITNLKADDYFKLFNIIDNKVLRKVNSRLSALLLNLTERRNNNWQKHHAESEGPKKLKDIKEDIAREQEQMNKVKSQKKANLELLHQKVKTLFKDWEADGKNQRQLIKGIIRQFSQAQFYVAFLKQVADEKKQVVRKRVQLFDTILDNYSSKIFRESWADCIKQMAFDSGDYPFIGSALALILKKVLQRQGNNKLKDYFKTFQDQDQQFFMDQVYGRLYHYTQNQDIKKFTSPNKKYSNMYDK